MSLSLGYTGELLGGNQKSYWPYVTADFQMNTDTWALWQANSSTSLSSFIPVEALYFIVCKWKRYFYFSERYLEMNEIFYDIELYYNPPSQVLANGKNSTNSCLFWFPSTPPRWEFQSGDNWFPSTINCLTNLRLKNKYFIFQWKAFPCFMWSTFQWPPTFPSFVLPTRTN